MLNPIRTVLVAAIVTSGTYCEITGSGSALAQATPAPNTGPTNAPQGVPITIPNSYWTNHWNWYDSSYRPYWNNSYGPGAGSNPYGNYGNSNWNLGFYPPNGLGYFNGGATYGMYGLPYQSRLLQPNQSLFSRPANYGWW